MRTNTEDSGEEIALFLQGDTEGVAEIGLSTPATLLERRELASLADSAFFNSFEDDVDESDMQP